MATIQIDLKYAILTLNGLNTPDTVRYVWDPEKVLLPYGAGSVRLGKGDDNVSLSSLTLNESWPEEPVWIFYVEDCAFPSFHAIQAATWEDAYEDFCEQEADRGHYLIKDDDPDYGPDDGHYCDDGRRVDSESFQSLGSDREPFRIVLAGSALPPRT
jgi:hypothetical protein